jgi:predicted O-methyltransferase YrrM
LNKLFKAFNAIALIIRNPWLLNKILEDDLYWKRKVTAGVGFQNGLPVIRPEEIYGDFTETIKPYAFGDGGSLPTDLALLVKLSRRIPQCRYFEIGTWRGESVANVARVANECFTLNLSDAEMAEMGLSDEYISQHRYFSKNLPNVIHLQGNTKTFDFDGLNRKFDLIFIDGDHHFEMVKNDTEKVFKYLVHEKTIIVWHDYARNPEMIRWEVFAGLLDGCPQEFHKDLFHAANTLCAVYYPGYSQKKHVTSGDSIGSFEVDIKFVQRDSISNNSDGVSLS